MGRIGQLGLVGIGGAVGAIVRWQVAEAWVGDGFPWATFVVNLAGCVVLGLLTTRSLSTELKRLLGTGFAGGLTTFSTLTVEVVRLLDRGSAVTAVVYIAASLVVGLVGYSAARSLGSEPEPAQ